MKNRNLLIRYISLFFTIIFLVCSVGCSKSEKAISIVPDNSIKYITNSAKGTYTCIANEGESIVSENEYLAMLYNSSNGVVSIFDKRDGKRYSTTANQNEFDKTASAQLKLTYSTSEGKSYSLNSYEESIKKEQVKIKKDTNGFTAIYTIGDADEGLEITPEKISDERFMKLIYNKCSTADKSFLKRMYSYLEDYDLWKRRNTKNEVQIKRLVEIMHSVGYTSEDLKKDNTDNGVNTSADEKIVFEVPVKYTLEYDSFTVSIDMSKIKYPKNNKLTKITLLEFFGAVADSREGYMFIPDGSGALIPFNTVSSDVDGYVATVYGDDYGMRQNVSSTKTQEIKMPVYGMSYADNGFISIIEQGEALANIAAYNSGSKHGYNVVYSEFDFLKTESMSLGSSTASDNYTYYNFQQKSYQGNITLRYLFLDSNNNDYSGMARAYRDYLINTKQLKQNSNSYNAPFVMETIAGAQKAKSFLGVNYTGVESITSFEESGKMVQNLKDLGVNNISLLLNGWYNGGMEYRLADSIKPLSDCGGKEELENLIKKLNDLNVNLYANIEYLKFSDSCGVIKQNNFTAHSLDSSVTKIDINNLSTLKKNIQISVNSYNLLRLSKLEDIIQKSEKAIQKLGINGISVGTMSNMVYSDFYKSAAYDRQSAMLLINNNLQDLKANNKLLLESPYLRNSFLADVITDIPMNSSEYNIQSQSVPFYQIVMHGSIPYTGSALNYAADVETEFLKCVEYGAGLKYIFIYKDPSVLRETDYNDYYASDFDTHKKDAAKYYKELNNIYTKVSDAKIKKHSCVATSVYCTEYENGVSIYVNYSQNDYSLSGISVPARGYYISGGAVA